MTYPWFESYAPGMKTEIALSTQTSLVSYFADVVAKFGSAPAFENMGACISYEQLDRLSTQFAAFLQKSAGLVPGDRVAIQLPNLLQYPVALLGTLKAGCVVVNTNPLYTPREMEHQFVDSGAKALVVLENFAKNVEVVLPKTKIQTVVVAKVGDLLPWPKSWLVNGAVKYIKKLVPTYDLPTAISFSEALLKGSLLKLDKPALTADDLAFLQYTGGTTGVSKGAMLSHGNMMANMAQIFEWMGRELLPRKEVIITPLPLYHIFSLTVNCFSFMQVGAKNVLITNPRDIPAFVADLKKHPFSVLTAVNTLFNGLLNNKDFSKLDFSHLKVAVGGGMAVQRAVADRWKEVTNTTLIEGYGLTETAPVLSCNPIWGGEKVGHIGIPLPSTHMIIVNEAGQALSQGEIGEIAAKGPQVMRGYWQRPDETAKVMTSEGYFKTGDIGFMSPDGFFKIVDRKKDMILVSGFNVFPNEVEDVIAMHPGVLEVAVVGVADEKSGEVVKAFVVKKDETLNEEAVREFARKSLTSYKVPRFVEFRKELPKTNVGKILRRALRTDSSLV